MLGVIVSIIVFAFILSFLVVIHELGHFVAAKWAKIKVEEFGLGYPPRALKLFTKWGTLFSLNWVPFGGFVKMTGEDGPEGEAEELEGLASTKKSSKTKSKSHSTEGPFYTKSAFAQLVVILAGATVNFVFGVLVFSLLFSFLGIPSGTVIGDIAANSPAAQAGLQPETAVTHFQSGGKIYNTPTTSEVVAFIDRHRGQTVQVFTTGRCEERRCESAIQSYTVYLRTKSETPAGEGAMGLRFSREVWQFYPWYEMPIRGAVFGTSQALGLGVTILQALQTLVVDLFSRGVVPQDLAGPIGIVDQASVNKVFFQGPLMILSFTASLSINLAVMNVLPIPALDGGRAVFIILEQMFGKKRIQRIENMANYGGFIFLIGLIVIISARDIFRIVVRFL